MKSDVLLSSDNDSSQNTFGLILVADHEHLVVVLTEHVAANIVSESLGTAGESQTYARPSSWLKLSIIRHIQIEIKERLT